MTNSKKYSSEVAFHAAQGASMFAATGGVPAEIKSVSMSEVVARHDAELALKAALRREKEQEKNARRAARRLVEGV